jgi:hypothetical protein
MVILKALAFAREHSCRLPVIYTTLLATNAPPPSAS